MASRPTKQWFTLITTAGAMIALAFAAKPVELPLERPLAIHDVGTPVIGDEAEPRLTRACGVLEDAAEPDHPALVSRIGKITDALISRGQFIKAERLARPFLAIFEKPPEIREPGIAELCEMAQAALGLGNRDEANALASRAIALAEKSPGQDGSILYETIVSWAATLKEHGRFADMVPFLERLLALLEANPNRESNDLMVVLISLGGIQAKLGQLPEAERLLRCALEVAETDPEVSPAMLVDALNNLGVCYLGRGRYAEAEETFRRALSRFDTKTKPDDSSTLPLLINLAHAVLQTSHRDEAEPLVRRALAIAEKASLPEGLELVSTLTGAAKVLVEVGYSDEARMLLKRALPMLEKLYGSDSLESAQGLELLAKIEHIHQDWAEVEAPLRRAIAIREQKAIPDDHWLQNDLYNLASIYHYQKKHAEAESLAKRAVELAERASCLNPDRHRDLSVNSLILQGRTALSQEHFGEAELPLTRAFGVLKGDAIKNREKLTECFSLLDWLYFKQGRQEDQKSLEFRFREIVPVDAAPVVPVPVGEIHAVPALPPGVAPGPPQLIVDGKPVPEAGFSTSSSATTPPPDALRVDKDLKSYFHDTPERFPQNTSDPGDKPKLDARKFPIPAYAAPVPLPDVLPETIPADPAVQKTSGDAKDPVVPPPSPK